MTQQRRVTSVNLVAKAGLPEAVQLSDTVLAWLINRGVATRRFLHPHEDVAQSLVPETDLILVFGGDGTMVSVCRRTLGSRVAVGGINFGRVGFLTELSSDSWQASLENAIVAGIGVKTRMSLHYRLLRDGTAVHEGEVVNDAVVSRGKVARLASLELAVNEKPFTTIRSDGLILSTPTGASGYAGSAGGPLMQPGVNAYIVAAICPYLSSFPPMVLRAETRFSVRVGESAPNLYLTLDGQEAHALQPGDMLEVYGIPERIFMADFGLKDYFERLCLAGFVHPSCKRQ